MFGKLKEKYFGGDRSGAKESPGKIKPALRFQNLRQPGGPHVVMFDEMRKDENGQHVLVLNLEGQCCTEAGQERLLLALDALAQNETIPCCLLVTEADYAALNSLIEGIQTSHGSALARVQFAIAP